MSGKSRLHFIAGKGGVGRTTIAAALAQALAQAAPPSRPRVLVVEMDEATTRAVGEHPALAATLGRGEALPPEPVRISAHLDAARLCSMTGHEAFLKGHLPGGALIAAALRSKAVRRFLESGPSFHELGQIAHLAHLAHSGHYAHIVVDLPATGHALGLARLPESMRRIISAGPVARALDQCTLTLRDPRRTTAWIVALPELLPVSETLELVEALEREGLPPPRVLLNRWPADPFSGDEALREAAAAFFDAHGPVGGSVAFGRLREAIEARARLPAARIAATLPHLAGRETRALVDALATSLVGVAL